MPFISDEIEAYADARSTPESALCRELAEETRAKATNPQMMIGNTEGLFLRALVRATGARRVLEIGTFTGYSALAMAGGLPEDGKLITCDIDPESTAIARAFWARSPYGARIELRLGPALDTIHGLDGPFDLAFIDADKGGYIDYWEAIVPIVRKGGVIVADNVLWSGRVLDPQEPDDKALAAFNKHVAADDRVEQVMLPVRDGITVATVL
jgi:caffeoyl-CoA O-methyltransferase